MAQPLRLVREKTPLPNSRSYPGPHESPSRSIGTDTPDGYVLYRRCGIYSKPLCAGVTHPTHFTLHRIDARLLQPLLSRSLYRETAPSPLTPPLKLMSAAKFSSLANRLRLRHRHQPCCLAPTTVLTGLGSSEARGSPPKPPGRRGIAGWERGRELQPPAAPLRGAVWVAALAALTRHGSGGPQVRLKHFDFLKSSLLPVFGGRQPAAGGLRESSDFRSFFRYFAA